MVSLEKNLNIKSIFYTKLFLPVVLDVDVVVAISKKDGNY